MNRTIIVRRNYAHYIKKYARCVGCSLRPLLNFHAGLEPYLASF